MATGASLAILLVSALVNIVDSQQRSFGGVNYSGYPSTGGVFSGYPTVYGNVNNGYGAYGGYPGYSVYGPYGNYGGYTGAINPLYMNAYGGGFAPVPQIDVSTKYHKQHTPLGSAEYYHKNSPLEKTQYINKNTGLSNTKVLHHSNPLGSTQYQHQISPFGKSVSSKKTYGIPGFPGYYTVKTETTKHYGYPPITGGSPLLRALHPAQIGFRHSPPRGRYPTIRRPMSSRLGGY